LLVWSAFRQIERRIVISPSPPEDWNLNTVYRRITSWEHFLKFTPFNMSIQHSDVAAAGQVLVEMGGPVFVLRPQSANNVPPLVGCHLGGIALTDI
jgi:hypothetical protein